MDTIKPFDIETTGGLVAFQISQYASAIETHITGIAPTLIAFRVAEEKPQTEVNGTNPLSRLTFRRSRLGAISRQLSTLRFGRNPHDGSKAIGKSNVDAQNSVGTEKAESYDANALEAA
ncbi:hypothetical protein D9619_009239 [Psilocybe cf. subviscida]|uniref:Uncharacterized protein n=1 Tax=Psilocybe cf. subviscida TaxID=2480587 RepID=A0A8H5FAA6_9AGAR|nr:hypothetical protein D9619_009239 [Psilocybe cf. subviscida]